MTATLEVDDIDVALGGVSILRDISFRVQPGQTLGIVGPNGAGKTTILNVISAVVPTIKGRVLFQGEPLSRVRPHRVRDLGIGRSLQSTHYFHDMTVLNLVSLGSLKNSVWGALRFSDHRKLNRAGRATRAAEVLELLDLTRYADRPLDELSTAVQKMVDMARALAVGTNLVLLDEPTSGVSGAERGVVTAALKTIRELGVTVVLIDHDPGFVMANCDTLMAMNFGEVIKIGDPRDVMNSPEVRTSYLGDSRQ